MRKDEDIHTVKRLNLYGFISKSVVKVLITLLLMVGAASAQVNLNINLSGATDVTLVWDNNTASPTTINTGMVLIKPNWNGCLYYTLSKTGFNSQSGCLWTMSETTFYWQINMNGIPSHKIRLTTSSGVGTAILYRNGFSFGTLDYYQNYVDITGLYPGDIYSVVYTPLSGQYVIEKYCFGEVPTQCTDNPSSNVVDGTMGTSDIYITFYNINTLSIATLSISETSDYHVRISVATNGKGILGISLNDTERDFTQILSTDLTTFDYIVPDGTLKVCAYDKNNIGDSIQCNYININHQLSTTPAPTPQPSSSNWSLAVSNSSGSVTFNYCAPVDSTFYLRTVNEVKLYFIPVPANSCGVKVVNESTLRTTYGAGIYRAVLNSTSNTHMEIVEFLIGTVTIPKHDIPLVISVSGNGSFNLYRNGALLGAISNSQSFTIQTGDVLTINHTIPVVNNMLDKICSTTCERAYTRMFIVPDGVEFYNIGIYFIPYDLNNPNPPPYTPPGSPGYTPPINNPVPPPPTQSNDFFQWMINSLSGMIGIGTTYHMPAMLGIVLTVVVCVLFGGATYRETKSTNMALIVCALMVFLSWVIGFFPGWALLLLIAIVVGINYLPAMLNKESA